MAKKPSNRESMPTPKSTAKLSPTEEAKAAHASAAAKLRELKDALVELENRERELSESLLHSPRMGKHGSVVSRLLGREDAAKSYENVADELRTVRLDHGVLSAAIEQQQRISDTAARTYANHLSNERKADMAELAQQTAHLLDGLLEVHERQMELNQSIVDECGREYAGPVPLNAMWVAQLRAYATATAEAFPEAAKV